MRNTTLRSDKRRSKGAKRAETNEMLKRACRDVGPGFLARGMEQLESRVLMTIVQPAGQTYLAFEAEDPQATITDLDGDGITWQRIGGQMAFKMNIRERVYTVDRVVLSEAAMTEDELNASTPQTVGVRPAAYPDLTGGTLTYDAVTDATGYNILRGTSASGPFAAVPGGTNVTDTTFTDDS